MQCLGATADEAGEEGGAQLTKAAVGAAVRLRLIDEGRGAKEEGLEAFLLLDGCVRVRHVSCRPWNDWEVDSVLTGACSLQQCYIAVTVRARGGGWQEEVAQHAAHDGGHGEGDEVCVCVCMYVYTTGDETSDSFLLTP